MGWFVPLPVCHVRPPGKATLMQEEERCMPDMIALYNRSPPCWGCIFLCFDIFSQAQLPAIDALASSL